MSERDERKLTLYRDDSTAQVAYTRVKSYFFTAGNTVLTISRYDAETGDGHIHWPRERFCWFRDEPGGAIVKCLTCDRTLAAGGASQPTSADSIETMFAELLGWTERAEGWTCAHCDSERPIKHPHSLPTEGPPK